MKRLYISFLMAVMFLAAGPLLSSCGGHGGEEHAEAHGHEHEHEGDLSEVEISEAQMKAVGITLGLPEERALSETVEATGVLALDPRYESVAAPLLGGIVTKICVAEGQHVGAGSVIAYVEAPEVAAMKEEYRTACALEDAARTELQRQEALATQGAGIKKNLDAARSALSVASIRTNAAAARLRQYGASTSGNSTAIPVKAPIAGTVTEVMATTGGFADMQSPVARIVDNSHVYCMLKIFEKDLPDIKTGESVEIRMVNNPDINLKGTVADINPVLDPESKTAPVKVTIDASDTKGLIPGMGVTASVSTSGRKGMALPEEAVVTNGGKSYIFVLEDIHDEEGEKMYHFEKQEVVCGTRSLGYIEITPLKPLTEESKVVTSKAFYLNSMASDHGEHSH